ncbi:MAG TPA: Smr/MutS family protein [Nitrospirota bacterium]|nr:Smr/MutS family protein [Nitrospirota bacterium]
MTRKKDKQQQAPDFKNNPFKSLRGFTPQSTAGQQKAKPISKRTQDSAEDAGLFMRETAGVRPLHLPEENEAADAPADRAKEQPRVPQAGEADLFLKAMRTIGAVEKTGERKEEEFLEESRRSPSSRLRQLKQGKIRISQELDLHGYLRDEAITRLERFIRESFERDRSAVLVITGKGLNSPEGPILQGAVSEWLRGKGKGMVAEFSPAPREKGGSGAVVVFLKKK